MRLEFEQRLPQYETVHYADGTRLIASHHNRVYAKVGDETREVVLPQPGWLAAVGSSRLARRLLRLDKMNVVPVGTDLQDLLIVRRGVVYRYDWASGRLHTTLNLVMARNALHQSIAVIDRTEIIFGEYGSNPNRLPVPIYRSVDSGQSWSQVFEIPAGVARHVHGCYWDPYEEKVWIFTGDFAGENHVLVSNRTFTDVEWLGNGDQSWRACSVFFEDDRCYWIMDSPLETSYLVRLNRKTRVAEKIQPFPGPVWYTKRTTDGLYLAGTTTEAGPAVHDKYARVFVSNDAENWTEAIRFRHDGLPKRLFKNGIVGFADGDQPSSKFYIFGEALRGLDGASALCKIEV